MSKRNDISQLIRKYLNGELDARAMHQLEREAQNDPFLMEALEGYEQSGKDQQKSLAEVDMRLHDRITKRERRIIPWRVIAIAASVLVVLTIGGLWVRYQSPEIKPSSVKITKPGQALPVTKQPAMDTVEKGIHEAATTKQIANNKPHKIKRQQHTVTNNGEVAVLPSADANTTSAPQKNNRDTAASAEVIASNYNTKGATNKDIQSRAKEYEPGNNNNASSNNLAADKVTQVYTMPGNNSIVTGTVTSRDDGLPIPGATVRVIGTNIMTQTNAAGKFTLSNVPKGATLILAFIGYNAQQIAVNKNSDLAVVMQPNTGSLAEVVVTGAMGIKHNNTADDDQVYENAQPVNGWGTFKKYLRDNAISPDDRAGVVRVSFTVDQNGYLSNFNIRKSLGTQTDDAAIKLIENGPGWKTNSDHKPEVVTVRVRFKQKQ